MIDEAYSTFAKITSLPFFYESIGVLCVLSVVGWFELRFLRIFFISHRIVSKTVHVASIHKKPIPYGGGIAVVDMFLLSLIVWLLFVSQDVAIPTILSWSFFAAITVICVVSFIDDVRPLSPLLRLLVQLVIVGLMMPLLPGPVLLGYFPLWFDWGFAFLFWAAFSNFFNFMDGIDGISGVETGSVGLGLFLFTIAVGDSQIFMTTGLAGLVLLTAACVFLLWNWHPAKIFLGDCGAVPIGFVIAGLMLQLASYGYWEAAVILPLYYYLDAGLTLLKRMIRGEKFWLPHVSHFYHMARISGHRHDRISRMILGNNLLLIVFAIGSLYQEVLSLIAAFATTSGLLIWMWRSRPAQP